MNRTTEAELLDFCARQHAAFDSRAWVRDDAGERADLVCAAFLLASSPWYGHRDELLDIVEALHPRGASAFPEILGDRDFDCARFHNTLRARCEPR